MLNKMIRKFIVHLLSRGPPITMIIFALLERRSPVRPVPAADYSTSTNPSVDALTLWKFQLKIIRISGNQMISSSCAKYINKKKFTEHSQVFINVKLASNIGDLFFPRNSYVETNAKDGDDITLDEAEA